MANISQVKLPNNTSYDIVSRQTRGLFRGNIDSTSTSTAFTATVPGITELYDGLMVVLKNSVVTTEANITLNINNLGAKSLYTSTRHAVVTTHWAKDTQWLLYFDATNDWWVMYQGVYTSNTNTIGEYAGSVTAGSAGIYKYSLALQTSSGWESPVLSSGTAASKTKNTHGFLIKSPILYFNGTSITTAGEKAAYTNCWTVSNQVDSRYIINNASKSWSAQGNPFYLKGTIVDDLFYLDNTTWWSKTLPNTEDGKYYWLIGYMSSGYQYCLHPCHPIFYYKDGEIRQYIPANVKYVNNHTVESNVPPNLGGTIVVAQTQPVNQNIGDVWLEISTT